MVGWQAQWRSAWQSPGIPPAPRTRSPAVPTFQSPSQFSKYVSHKNKISDTDALRSPVPAVHNSFTVSIAHYSHIPPAELSISSLAKLESESWESSEVVVVWVCHFYLFIFSPHSFLTALQEMLHSFCVCRHELLRKRHISSSRSPDLVDFRGIKICDCPLDAETH